MSCCGARERPPRPQEMYKTPTRSDLWCYFCFGSWCRSENYKNHKSPAIPGMNSDWVTDEILVTQRPNPSTFADHNLVQNLKASGVAGVMNVQVEGEHAHCGLGLIPGGEFSYDPTLLTEAGIQYAQIGWADQHVPPFNVMRKVVDTMTSMMKEGKILVHCHAGQGRSGTAVACYLATATTLSAQEIIKLIRAKRPRCLTHGYQQKYVEEF